MSDHLTAHQRLAIRQHLPEVRDVYVKEGSGIINFHAIYLRLHEAGITISLVRESGTTSARRMRRAFDYSDRAQFGPNNVEMQQRLVPVFGPLAFGPESDKR